MTPVPSGVHVWLATGHTDMPKGFDGLALLVQEVLKRNRTMHDNGIGPTPDEVDALMTALIEVRVKAFRRAGSDRASSACDRQDEARTRSLFGGDHDKPRSLLRGSQW
jgi:hypothetical protein